MSPCGASWTNLFACTRQLSCNVKSQAADNDGSISHTQPHRNSQSKRFKSNTILTQSALRARCAWRDLAVVIFIIVAAVFSIFDRQHREGSHGCTRRRPIRNVTQSAVGRKLQDRGVGRGNSQRPLLVGFAVFANSDEVIHAVVGARAGGTRS